MHKSGSSNLGVHHNGLEGLLKHPARVLDSVGLDEYLHFVHSLLSRFHTQHGAQCGA